MKSVKLILLVLALVVVPSLGRTDCTSFILCNHGRVLYTLLLYFLYVHRRVQHVRLL